MLRPLVRSIAWVPMAVVAVCTVALVAAPRADTARLQLIAIVVSGAVGFAFDDGAATTVAASPTSLLRRRLLRLALMLAAALAVWGSAVWFVGTASAAETRALLAMFAGLLGLSIGTAGVAVRRSSRGRAGLVVAPTLLVLSLASTIVPPRWRPLPFGDVPGGWTAIYLRWSAAAVVGLLVFLASSRDPAARRLRHGGPIAPGA